MELTIGVEPTAFTLQKCCSTTELSQLKGLHENTPTHLSSPGSTLELLYNK